MEETEFNTQEDDDLEENTSKNKLKKWLLDY